MQFIDSFRCFEIHILTPESYILMPHYLTFIKLLLQNYVLILSSVHLKNIMQKSSVNPANDNDMLIVIMILLTNNCMMIIHEFTHSINIY